MKNLIISISLLFLIAFTGCRNSSTTETQNKQSVKGIIDNEVYSFSWTTDPSYCSPDSIVGTDCGGGDFYFTKNGNVVYSFDCLGNDTTTYDIGRYSFNGNNITCTFSRSYSFYGGSDYGDEGAKEATPNEGELVDIKHWSIQLLKINCTKYEYYFIMEKDKYVLEKLGSEKLDELRKIKSLQNL